MSAPNKCPKCGADSWDTYDGRVHFSCGASYSLSDGKYRGTIDEFDPCEINILQRQRDQLAATLEAQRRGAANAERMLCEAIGVESGADVLDAIATLRDRVKRLEEAGDKMLSAWLMPEDSMDYSDWVCLSSDAKRGWHKAKEAKP